jgi:hypothetical protein
LGSSLEYAKLGIFRPEELGLTGGDEGEAYGIDITVGMVELMRVWSLCLLAALRI